MISSRTIVLLGLVAMAGLSGCTDDANGLNVAQDQVQLAAAQPASIAKLAADNAPAAVSVLGGAAAGLYSLDKQHAYITFSYSHKGFSNPFLRFRTWDAELDLNTSQLAKSRVTVTIDVNSIDTGVDKFDSHLRSDDWFAVDSYPQVTFSSSSYTPTGANTGRLSGELTMMGVTKPLELDATINKSATDARSKKNIVGISGRGKLNRSDWGLGKYAPIVGDEVELIIEAEFEQQ